MTNSKNKRPAKRRSRTRKRKRSTRKRKVGLSPYLKLIADPCDAPLTRSFAEAGGSTIVERTRQSITLAETSGANSVHGYVLWFPSYHGAGNDFYEGQNFYYFVNSNSGVKPINSSADPLGRGAAASTGQWLTDPAYPNLQEDSLFSTGRTISACLTMDYIGTLQSAKGQFAVVQNLDVNALVDSKRDLDFPSVDEIFDYAMTRGRTPLEGHQVIWRPSDEDAKQRSASYQAGNTTKIIPDALFISGSSGGETTKLNEVDPGQARGVLIAWRGLPENSLVFNAVKVAEYTLAMKSKNVEVPVVATPPGKSIDSAVAMLDSYVPGWQQSALRGATTLAKKAMESYILPSAATYLSAAPSMPRIMDGEL